MNNEENDQPVDALSGLDRERMPPRELEDRVVEQLRTMNLLRRHSPLWLSVAAAIAIFALGILAGKAMGTSAESTQFNYVLLLREDPGIFREPAHERTLVQEYTQWAREIAEGGTKITGEKLHAESRILMQQNGATKIQGMKPDPMGAIAGFFLIEAPSDQIALEKAMDCPHLRYGGSIELRRIDSLRSNDQ